jgi:hypothetical protein
MSKLNINYVFIFLLAIGVASIVAAERWELGRIADDFGVAFLISGFLGLTVEQYTKKRFTAEIASDVFKASIGHTLPACLRDEMLFLSSRRMTENPRVFVQAPDDIDFVVSFPRETVATKDAFLYGQYRFRGGVLPVQEIRVRWWKKDEMAKWLAAFPPSSN